MSFAKKFGLWLEKPIMLVFRRHADYMTRVRVVGRAVDGRTRQPLAGVRLTFLDTGFDARRSKNPEEFQIEIGETGSDGTIDRVLDYVWSIDIVWRMATRLGDRFSLRFERDGFTSVTREFRTRDLSIEDNVLQASFDDVPLPPTRKVA